MRALPCGGIDQITYCAKRIEAELRTTLVVLAVRTDEKHWLNGSQALKQVQGIMPQQLLVMPKSMERSHLLSRAATHDKETGFSSSRVTLTNHNPPAAIQTTLHRG